MHLWVKDFTYKIPQNMHTQNHLAVLYPIDTAVPMRQCGKFHLERPLMATLSER